MNRIDAALFLLRIVFGVFLACHGLNKSRGIAGTAGWFGSIGMKWPRAQAITASASEIIAGVLLAVGLLTPLACAIVVSLMVVAIVTVHWRVGFFIFLPNGGWEYCASIAVLAASVAVGGPGRVSLDHALGWENGATTGVAAVAVGVAAAVVHLSLSYRRKEA